MELIGKRTFLSVLSCLLVGGVFFGGYQLAFGQNNSAGKKINIVVMYASAAEPLDAIRFEDSVGYDQVSPFLTQRGYEVENVFSMHRLAISNGGLERSLINAFADAPSRDDARMLFVTVAAEPGDSYTVRTNLALIDAQTSGLIKARRNLVAAHVDKLWTYESEPLTAPPARAAKAFDRQLEAALTEYDNNFQVRPKK